MNTKTDLLTEEELAQIARADLATLNAEMARWAQIHEGVKAAKKADRDLAAKQQAAKDAAAGHNQDIRRAAQAMKLIHAESLTRGQPIAKEATRKTTK